jgi:hypothetical protein
MLLPLDVDSYVSKLFKLARSMTSILSVELYSSKDSGRKVSCESSGRKIDCVKRLSSLALDPCQHITRAQVAD